MSVCVCVCVVTNLNVDPVIIIIGNYPMRSFQNMYMIFIIALFTIVEM